MTRLTEATRFPITRLAIARTLTLLAICVVPASEKKAISLLFDADDLLKARKRLALEGSRSDG